MKPIVLSPSLSRKAAGIYEVERMLARFLNEFSSVEVEVFGLQDSHTQSDRKAWGALEPKAFTTVGPSAYGYAPGLIEALDNSNADLLHLHALWMYTSFAALKWAQRENKPYVISPHGMLRPRAYRRSRWKKKIVQFLYEDMLLEGASCIHALTPEEKESIRDFGLDNPICTIPSGVSLPPPAGNERPIWRETIDRGDHVLLYLGRLHRIKGLGRLLDAWSDVYGESCSQDWHLVFVGWDDGDEDALREKVRNENVKARTHFLGPRFGMEKATAFQHADAFVLPSESEGLPMSVLEAWAYRLPVLMTAECNLAEGFRESAALRIRPKREDIRDGLRELFDLPRAQRQEMGARGQSIVKKKYSWESLSEDMKDVYSWVVGEKQQPNCVHL